MSNHLLSAQKATIKSLSYNDATLCMLFHEINHTFDSTKTMRDNLYILKDLYKTIVQTPNLDRYQRTMFPKYYRWISKTIKQLERRNKVGAFQGHNKTSKMYETINHARLN